MTPPETTAADGLAGGGEPLEAGVRDQLSAAYRHDFSPVRVHVGEHANRAARGLGALAYTVGNDVVFRDGTYDPLSDRGRSLIAHEVAHVAQHGGRAYAPNFLLEHPASALPDADGRLERQADTASALHREGLPRGWAWERAVRPFLGRVDEAWQPPPGGPYPVTYAGGTRMVQREQWSTDEPTVARVDLGEFVVPQTKGPWGERYDEVAKAGGLQTVIDVSKSTPRSSLKDKRAPTSELRNLWLLHVQWRRDHANAWWEEAGGSHVAGREFDPRTSAGPAQIDHIVEMQLGGTNVPENLAPHNARDNVDSGRTIWGDVREAAVGVKHAIGSRTGGRALHEVVLVWTSARQTAAYATGAALPVLPAQNQEPVLAQRRGQASTAARVHLTAIADLKAGTRPGAADRAEVAKTQAALRDYPIKAAMPATLRVPDTPPDKGERIENSEVPQNHAARELIPGLVLSNLTRPARASGRHTVIAWLGSDMHPARAGGRLPITIAKERDQRLELDVAEPFTTGTLSLRRGDRRVEFTYPYLSTGDLMLSIGENGLVGQGHLRPSVPLLSRARMDVTLGNGQLSGTLRPTRNQIALPPFHVTDVGLAVELAPALAANGFIAFKLGSIVTGRVEGGVDGSGLFARGDVEAHVPGLDQATGHIEYRRATGVTGFAVATASRPTGLVRGGEVRIDFAGQRWTPSGRIDLMLPGDSPAQLTVHRAGERVVYTGRARLNVRGLHPVNVELSYDGEHLSGSAQTTFDLLGGRGTIDLRYREGKFSGKGAVDLTRGRFTGHLDAELHEHGGWTGRGSGSITIRPGLIGTIGLEYGRDRRLKTTGELRFPTYRFLEPRPARRQIFDVHLPDIPIFAISLGIGSVGLVARVGAAMYAGYSFGPGEIRDMVIGVTMYPLEDDPDAQLMASARLVLPAELSLEMQFRAGIAASVVIASATGYVTLTGGVRLRGGLDASAQLTYGRGVLTFDAMARIMAGVVLTLDIGALITIDAPLAGPWEWPFTFGSWSYDTGLQFGLEAPFHYRSDQPLQLPSVSDIHWIVPDLDVGQLADSVASKVRRGIGV